MPGLPVIPEVDYDTYARHVAKRRRKRGTSQNGTSWNLTNGAKYTPQPKRDSKQDYYGLDNSMKKLTLNRPRRWRTKETVGGPKVAWQSITDNDRNDRRNQKDDDDDKLSVASVDRHILRNSRSSMYTKYKYPEKYHHGFRNQQAQLEENIPQCLRKYPRYCNQPVRQDCAYNPIRSVTRLNVHSIRSGCLPHPNPSVTGCKKRRPTSAPPGTITSHSNVTSTQKGHFTRKGPVKNDNSKETVRPQTAFGNRSEEPHVEDLERNGSYEYIFDDEPEEEGPSHVTLEVIDSDEDPYDFTSVNDDANNFQSLSSTMKTYTDSEQETEYARESPSRKRTPSPNRNRDVISDAEEVASEAGYSDDRNSYVNSDKDTESAKSVDYEPEYF